METKYLDALYQTDFTEIFEKNIEIEWPLKIETVKNAFVLPADFEKNEVGVADENGEVVGLANFDALNPIDAFQLSEVPELTVAKSENKSVIYLGVIRNQWGHFLMDGVSRLWSTLAATKNKEFVYVGDVITNPAVFEFFELLGIKKEQLHYISKITQFDEVIVPEASYVPGKYIHRDFLKIFDQILEKIPENSESSKIYLSRTRLTGLKEWGEAALETTFRKNGYRIIYPEQLLLAEQVQFIRSADKIACLSGTLPHTLVFAKKTAEIVVFNKSYKRENYRQAAIDALKNYKITYVDSHISLAPVFSGGPFWIQKNANVRQFLTDHQLTDTADKQKSYFWRYVSAVLKLYANIWRGTKQNPVAVIEQHNMYTKKATIRQLLRFYFPRLFS